MDVSQQIMCAYSGFSNEETSLSCSKSFQAEWCPDKQ